MPEWKSAMFRTRNRACTCRLLIPGVMSERRDPSCPVHGREGNEEAEKAREYDSIEAYYSEDERRRVSGEADYGVHWRRDGRDWPRWRVSYVHATGEVYAQEHVNGRVVVLGVVAPDVPFDGKWPREIYYRTLDRVLEGWSDPSIQDVAWVAERLAEYERQVEA